MGSNSKIPKSGGNKLRWARWARIFGFAVTLAGAIMAIMIPHCIAGHIGHECLKGALGGAAARTLLLFANWLGPPNTWRTPNPAICVLVVSQIILLAFRACLNPRCPLGRIFFDLILGGVGGAIVGSIFVLAAQRN
jgi:hypothetical protein